MSRESFHISEQELLLAADGELSRRKMAKVHEHLAACWTCRARMSEIEASILEFARIHHRNLNTQVPPSNGPRARLQARLSELTGDSKPHFWERALGLCCAKRVVVAASVALLMAVGIAIWRPHWETFEPNPTLGLRTDGMRPDPALTPGMTQPLTKAELCAVNLEDSTPAIPRPVALRVFASYGIHEPEPRAYELDYLVTPELGGTNDVRNLWPQAYRAGPWNAHAKDALEDRLYSLVCEGKLSLAAAQRDLSADWVAAYKKYFQTEDPLPVHAAFLKDRPWE